MFWVLQNKQIRFNIFRPSTKYSTTVVLLPDRYQGAEPFQCNLNTYIYHIFTLIELILNYGIFPYHRLASNRPQYWFNVNCVYIGITNRNRKRAPHTLSWHQDIFSTC